MAKFLIFAATLLAGASFANAYGGYVGNGGDAITCRKDVANRLNGYYALDYIATLPALDGDDGLRAVGGWAASQARLTSLLRNKLPALAQSFDHFTSLIFNTSYAQDRVWESSPFGLEALNDQRLTGLIPANCREATDPKVIQAVVRLYQQFSGTSPGHIVYKYDPQLLQQLDQQAPLQLSFLFVHEWLWDLSANVDRNRRVNRFLHSVRAENLSPAEFEAELRGMGLPIPSLQDDEFSDKSCQGYPLDAAQIHAYYPGANVMSNWGRLKIVRREQALKCFSGTPDCDLNWRATLVPLPQLNSAFYLSPNWAFSSSPTPIGIFDSGSTGSVSNPTPGAADIRCGFVTAVDHNLECTINDSSLFNPLFGDLDHSPLAGVSPSTSRPPTSTQPLITATLTEECFRMKVVGAYSNFVSDASHPDEEIPNTTETIFYLHAPKDVFLTPKP